MYEKTVHFWQTCVSEKGVSAGYGVIFNFHSYNYQREEKVPWPMNETPGINIGTGPVNRELLGDVKLDWIGFLMLKG